jgi:hypothetical protein
MGMFGILGDSDETPSSLLPRRYGTDLPDGDLLDTDFPGHGFSGNGISGIRKVL